MTTPRRYSGDPHPQRTATAATVQVHVIGTPTDVEQAVGRIAHVLDVVDQSRPKPRRDEPGRVTVYVKARTDD